MSTSYKLKMLAAAAVTLFALPLAGAAEAGPFQSGHATAKHAKGAPASPVAYRGMRARLATPVISRRIANQSERIRAGRRAGRLTRFEALRLNGRLLAIRSALKVARFDGRVSERERGRIKGMLNSNSQRIKRLAQNRRHR